MGSDILSAGQCFSVWVGFFVCSRRFNAITSWPLCERLHATSEHGKRKAITSVWCNVNRLSTHTCIHTDTHKRAEQKCQWSSD